MRSRARAQDLGARVAVAEHAVAEPHQPLAGGELALGPGGDVAARFRLVDQVEGRARRAAVQRAGKGAIGAERGGDQRGALEATTRAVKAELLRPLSISEVK